MSDETAIQGWTAIAKLFNCNRRTMMRRKDDLANMGVIFYRKTGRPPRKTVCAFPSMLKFWATKKSLEKRAF